MARTAVVTDSNSGILPAMGEALGVYVVPMPFTIDGTTYYEGVSLTAERFFRYLEAGAEVSTSQPAPGELQELWDQVLQAYDELVYIPMTSSLSGSCMSAVALAEEYGGRVQVADNKRISLLQKQSVLEAVALRDRGVRAAEIKEILEAHALEHRIYLGVDSLKQLRKGGRISPAAAAVGTALQIKPVLRLWEGGIDMHAKVRGRRQMEQKLIASLRQDLETDFAGKPVSLYVAYVGTPEEGEAWRQTVQAAFPDHPVTADVLSLVIACHTGLGAFGIGLAQNLEI